MRQACQSVRHQAKLERLPGRHRIQRKRCVSWNSITKSKDFESGILGFSTQPDSEEVATFERNHHLVNRHDLVRMKHLHKRALKIIDKLSHLWPMALEIQSVLVDNSCNLIIWIGAFIEKIRSQMEIVFDLLLSVSAHDIRNKELIDIRFLPVSNFRWKLNDPHHDNNRKILFEFCFRDYGVLKILEKHKRAR